MATAYGYVLFSSSDETSFIYYGITTNPVDRLKSHLRETNNRWKRSTIQREIANGHSIHLRVLFQYDSEAVAYADEDYWITSLRRAGHRLANLAPGGLGGISQPVTDRALYGQKMRAWHANPENKSSFMKSLREAEQLSSTKSARSAGQVARFSREDERLANAQRISALYEDEEYARRMREVHTTSEIIGKIRDSNKRVYEDEPTRREESSKHAKRGWDSLTPEQRTNRVLRSKLGKRLSAAKKSGWVFDLTPVNTCEVNHEAV